MQNTEQKEKNEAECLVILSRIAELEQQIADNEPFGAEEGHKSWQSVKQQPMYKP
jgi:hypothetical protein